MSNKNIKRKQNNDIDIGSVIHLVLIVLTIIGIIWGYFNIYKPEERNFVKGTRYAYKIIQDEAFDYYKKNGYVYYSKEDSVDDFCQVLAKKNSKSRSGKCTISNQIGYQENFVFKNKKIAVYGMEKPAREVYGQIVKDFYIDVNGKSGKNTMGIDIFPMRIYSTGMMAGMVAPVNCRVEDYKRYEMDISPVCQSGIDANYLDTKTPLSFSIIQIGGKDGKNRILGNNMSFLRADCSAFGSELLGYEDFCNQRGYQWLTACYHEYYCAIELTQK